MFVEQMVKGLRFFNTDRCGSVTNLMDCRAHVSIIHIINTHCYLCVTTKETHHYKTNRQQLSKFKNRTSQ